MYPRGAIENRCADCDQTFKAPADIRRHPQHLCADMGGTMHTQNNSTATSEEAETTMGTHQCRRKSANPGQTEVGEAWETRSIAPRTTYARMTETEKAKEQPENNHHVRGRPRQHKESRENAKGALKLDAETETWQCAKCEKKYASSDARGAATHVANHTRENQNRRRRQEQQILQENAYRNTDETWIRTFLQYGRATRNIREAHIEHARTRTEETVRTERRRAKPS